MQKYLLMAGFVGIIAFIIYGYQDVCPSLTPTERLGASSAVFTGLVEGVDDDADTADVTLLSVWKGDLPDQITMKTKYLKKDHIYLIYGLNHNGDWFASNCGGYVRLKDATKAVEELGKPIAIKAAFQ